MRPRFFLAVLVVMALAALPVFAKANFSGDWKLNVSKSDFGPMPPPSSGSMKNTHEDPKLKVASKQSSEMGEFEAEFNYTTDGKECTNEIMGNPMKSTLKWDGDTLVIESKAKFGDNDFTMVDKWTLSPDGKTINVSRHFSSSMGEADSKLIFEKQ